MKTEIKKSIKSVCDMCPILEERINGLEQRLEAMQKEYLEKLYSLQCKVISFQSQFIELLPTEEVEKLKEEEKEISENEKWKEEYKKEEMELLNEAIERHEYKPVLRVGKTKDDG